MLKLKIKAMQPVLPLLISSRHENHQIRFFLEDDLGNGAMTTHVLSTCDLYPHSFAVILMKVRKTTNDHSTTILLCCKGP